MAPKLHRYLMALTQGCTHSVRALLSEIHRFYLPPICFLGTTQEKRSNLVRSGASRPAKWMRLNATSRSSKCTTLILGTLRDASLFCCGFSLPVGYTFMRLNCVPIRTTVCPRWLYSSTRVPLASHHHRESLENSAYMHELLGLNLLCLLSQNRIGEFHTVRATPCHVKHTYTNYWE